MESIHHRAARIRHPWSYFVASRAGTVICMIVAAIVLCYFIPTLLLAIPVVLIAVPALRVWSNRRDRKLGTVWPAQVQAEQDANRAAWGADNRRAAGWDRPQPEYWEPPR